jgi:hypothetical protein
MRRLLLAATLVLAHVGIVSCGGAQSSSATKLDDRTFKIEGPGVPGGAEAPNRRTAERVCPNGYRVLDRLRFKDSNGEFGGDSAVYTNWVIRCL